MSEADLYSFTVVNCLIFLSLTINGRECMHEQGSEIAIQYQSEGWVGCGEPGTPNNGIKEKIQDEWTYVCNKGFILVGHTTRKCMQNGTWAPKQMPKCVYNLAYNKIVKHNHCENAKHNLSVDNEEDTCETQMEHVYGYIDLEEPILFDTVTILVEADTATFLNIFVTNNTDVTQPWFNDIRTLKPLCSTNNKGPTVRFSCKYMEVARFVVIHLFNQADICEITVYNSKEVTSCGQPDRPLHCRIRKWNVASFEYQCDIGQAIQEGPVMFCNNGNWLPGTYQNISSVSAITTFTRPVNKYDLVFTGITGIALGVTVTLMASVIGCFFIRKYYKSRNRGDHVDRHEGNQSDGNLDPSRMAAQRSRSVNSSVCLIDGSDSSGCTVISQPSCMVPRNERDDFRSGIEKEADCSVIYENTVWPFLNFNEEKYSSASQTSQIYDYATTLEF